MNLHPGNILREHSNFPPKERDVTENVHARAYIYICSRDHSSVIAARLSHT
jgi:hypothetical protein